MQVLDVSAACLLKQTEALDRIVVAAVDIKRDGMTVAVKVAAVNIIVVMYFLVFAAADGGKRTVPVGEGEVCHQLDIRTPVHANRSLQAC